MNEFDAMRLLADANPVQAQDLTPLDAPDHFTSRLPNRRLVAAIAIGALAAAAVVGIFAFNGSNSARNGSSGGRTHLRVPTGHGPTGAAGVIGPTGSLGPIVLPGPTGRSGPSRPIDPTAAFYADGPTGRTGPTRTAFGVAEPTSLADARDALGAALVLPDVPPVDSSGITKVVKDCGESTRSKACGVGIGFLAQRIWIYYQPAAQWSASADPLAAYKNSVKYDSPARIVYFSGTPALISQSGRNIEFLIGNVHIRVWVVDPVPTGGATLQPIAESIVDRSK